MVKSLDLKPEEIEVLELLKRDYTFKEIADGLEISEKEVMKRLGNACSRNDIRGNNSIKVLLMFYEDKLEDR